MKCTTKASKYSYHYLLIGVVSFVILGHILGSCSKTSQPEVPPAKELKGRYLGYDEDLSLPLIIDLMDTLIIVVDEAAFIDDHSEPEKNAIHLFSRDEVEYLYSIGRLGKGYNEIGQPWVTDVKNDQYWVFDLARYEMIELNVDPDKAKQTVRRRIKFRDFDTYYPVWVGDSTLLSLGFTYNRFDLRDDFGRVIAPWGSFPRPNKDDYHFYYFAKSFQGSIDYNSRINKAVVANKFCDVLEIWDLDNWQRDTLLNFSGGFFPKLRKDKRNDFVLAPNEKYGYTGVFCTDSRIFGLFSGQSEEIKGLYAYYGWTLLELIGKADY